MGGLFEVWGFRPRPESRISLLGRDIASLILHLYGCGYQTADGLKAILDAQMDDDMRRYG